jgi:hypothetical protein
MNKKNVVSLELSKKLKEVGYPQEGECWWTKTHQWVVAYQGWVINHYLDRKNGFVAPLASEIIERLPSKISDTAILEILKLPEHYVVDYWCFNKNKGLRSQTNISFCDALAKMYIYLAEHKLLEED